MCKPAAPPATPPHLLLLIAPPREEGLAGLWKGLGPNIARNAIINAAELASYDQIKQSLLASGLFQDNVVTHLAAGLGAGFFAVCVGSPVDVVKSRIMGEGRGGGEMCQQQLIDGGAGRMGGVSGFADRTTQHMGRPAWVLQAAVGTACTPCYAWCDAAPHGCALCR